jgi:hypothetical protein
LLGQVTTQVHDDADVCLRWSVLTADVYDATSLAPASCARIARLPDA